MAIVIYYFAMYHFLRNFFSAIDIKVRYYYHVTFVLTVCFDKTKILKGFSTDFDHNSISKFLCSQWKYYDGSNRRVLVLYFGS